MSAKQPSFQYAFSSFLAFIYTLQSVRVVLGTSFITILEHFAWYACIQYVIECPTMNIHSVYVYLLYFLLMYYTHGIMHFPFLALNFSEQCESRLLVHNATILNLCNVIENRSLLIQLHDSFYYACVCRRWIRRWVEKKCRTVLAEIYIIALTFLRCLFSSSTDKRVISKKGARICYQCSAQNHSNHNKVS